MSSTISETIATSGSGSLEAPVALGSASGGFRLRSGLRFCRIGTRFVFLDLNASRYFLLEGEAALHFASFLDATADDAVLGRLRAQHLVEAGAPVAASPLPPMPTRSIFDAVPPRARPWLVAEALCEQSAARRRVRREPLSTLMGNLELRTVDLDACRPIAAACRAAARYRSTTDQCLPNSIAMRNMLARRGISANLIIGVMLPFAAHCWLQSGDTVLTDPFGSIQNFRPLAAS